MMFSSNQVVKISGQLDVEYIKKALEFALEYSGENEALDNNRSELVYQKTKNSFCIGWNLKGTDIADGWIRFDFDFDLDIIARLIIQFLGKQNFTPIFDDFDGAVARGFLMQDIRKSYNKKSDIKNKFYGIVEFKPYMCYYAK